MRIQDPSNTFGRSESGAAIAGRNLARFDQIQDMQAYDAVIPFKVYIPQVYYTAL